MPTRDLAAPLALAYQLGLPTAHALAALAADEKNTRLSKALSTAAKKVARGAPLHDIAPSHPDLFDSTLTAFHRAGATRGTLDVTLQHLADLRRALARLDRLPARRRADPRVRAARIAHSLGAALSAGLPVEDALRVADLRLTLRPRESLAAALRRSSLFPRLLQELLEAGESLHTLPAHLLRVAEHLETELLF